MLRRPWACRVIALWLLVATLALAETGDQECIVTEAGGTVCFDNKDGDVIEGQALGDEEYQEYDASEEVEYDNEEYEGDGEYEDGEDYEDGEEEYEYERYGEEEDEEEECLDEAEDCSTRAENDECSTDPDFMLSHCRKSCLVCNEWGVAQEIHDDATRQVVEATREYMLNQVFVEEKYENVREQCRNRHTLCSFWVSVGECENNPTYMQLQCPPACQTCEQVDFFTRCPYDPETTPSIWDAGDLERMFTNLTNDASVREKHNPKILSRDPWVVLLENFVADDECDRLIQLGAHQGYERSADVGEVKFDGTFDNDENEGRTSTNAWCVDDCFEDTITQNVLKRIEDIIGVPDVNSEYLQLLRYEESQFYQEHHDYIPIQKDRAEGVRILTVFLYLNDVEAGGGTNFPRLDLTVTPKRGRALIWPSVLDENPHVEDPRTHHQALPVEAGIKYGANAWVHQRDFKTPHHNGCA